MSATEQLGQRVGVRHACEALGVSRASLYRRRRPLVGTPTPRPHPPLALTPNEREQITTVLHTERFVDQAPRAVYATLLEEGRYLAPAWAALADFEQGRADFADRLIAHRNRGWLWINL